MKTPKFWKTKNFYSFVLSPISKIYELLRFLHVLFSKRYQTQKFKILCIGNLTAGGNGKTPIAIEIGKILKEKKINFAYLSKGYKGKINNFIKIDLQKHNCKLVGDEPLILAEIADTFVCKSRKIAIKMLEKYNYDLIVMDDGFQNPSIFKDKNILIIDGEYGFGNKKLLPAGPLREKIETAIKRVDFCVILGEDKQNIQEFLENNEIEFIKAIIKEKNILKDNKKYIAFCGIGRPEKFFDSLKKTNCNVTTKYIFEDHHIYFDKEIQKILNEAIKNNAKIITTKKDWIKLSEDFKNKIDFLDIEIDFKNKDNFINLLLKNINYEKF